jgi:hypothetical protein
MSIIDNIVAINRKLAEIDFTNLETLQFLKNANTANYLVTIKECYEKHPEDNAKYFVCVVNKECPKQLKNFQECQKKSKEVTNCVPALY